MNSWNGTIVFPVAFHDTSVVTLSFVMFTFPSQIWTQTPINTHWVTNVHARKFSSYPHTSAPLHIPSHLHMLTSVDYLTLILLFPMKLYWVKYWFDLLLVTSNMIRVSWLTRVNWWLHPIAKQMVFCHCYLAWSFGLYPFKTHYSFVSVAQT